MSERDELTTAILNDRDALNAVLFGIRIRPGIDESGATILSIDNIDKPTKLQYAAVRRWFDMWIAQSGYVYVPEEEE